MKPHTDICKPPNSELVGFDCGGIIGSGLSKICAIGAGKLEGAKAYHDHVLGCGLETAIVIATRELIRAGRVIGGIAILENAYHQTAKLEGAFRTSMLCCCCDSRDVETCQGEDTRGC